MQSLVSILELTMAAPKEPKRHSVVVESDEDEKNVQNTPPEVRQKIEQSREARLLPKKSGKAYERAYEKFMEWFNVAKAKNSHAKVSESFVVAYFESCISAASGWSIYSRLKPLIQSRHGVDMEKMPTLQASLKRRSQYHTPTQAPTFTLDQLNTFLKDAPNDDSNKINKLAVLFGLSGGLRIEELTMLERKDITEVDGFLKVSLNDSKTGPRSFIVHPHKLDHMNAVIMYQNYLKMITPGITSPRVWLRIEDGKLQDRPIGKNTLAGITKKIAEYLELPEPSKYTSHSLRRTGATLLAEKGVSTEALRAYGGWKNASTAQVYIENTVSNKKRLAASVIDSEMPTKKVCPPTPSIMVQTPVPTAVQPSTINFITGSTLHDCVIHIHQGV